MIFYKERNSLIVQKDGHWKEKLWTQENTGFCFIWSLEMFKLLRFSTSTIEDKKDIIFDVGSGYYCGGGVSETDDDNNTINRTVKFVTRNS